MLSLLLFCHFHWPRVSLYTWPMRQVRPHSGAAGADCSRARGRAAWQSLANCSGSRMSPFALPPDVHLKLWPELISTLLHCLELRTEVCTWNNERRYMQRKCVCVVCTCVCQGSLLPCQVKLFLSLSLYLLRSVWLQHILYKCLYALLPLCKCVCLWVCV